MNLYDLKATLTLDTSDYESGVNSAKTDTQKMESELSGLSQSLGGVETDAGEASSALDSMSKIEAFETIADAAETVVDKILEIGSAAMETKDEIEESTAKAAAYLGQTGDAAEETADVIQDVYENGWGDSLDQVSDAVITVTENLGELDSTSLKNVTTQALALESSGVDMSESLRGVNSLMEQYGLTAEEAMDLYVSGINNGLNKTDELGDNIAEYAGAFADAGYSAEEYFQLLQNGADNGAYNLDKVNDAINEATTRLEDGTIEESLDMFSDSTADLFQAWQDGGATQKDVIESIVNDIANCEDEQDALNMAAEAFGTMGEDGSLKFISSLTAVGDTYSDVEGSADQFTDTLSTDASTMEGNMRALQDAIAPLGELYQNALSPVIGGLADIVSKIMEVVENSPALQTVIVAITAAMTAFAAVMAIRSTIQGVTTAMKALGITMKASPIMIVVTAIAALVAAFVYLWNNCDAFREFWLNLWENVQAVFSTVTEAISAAVESLAEGFSMLWQGIQTVVYTILTAIVSFIENGMNAIYTVIDTVLTTIQTIFSTIWNAIVMVVTTVVTTIKTTIKTVFTTVKKVITTILNAIKTVFTTVWTAIKTTVTNLVTAIKTKIVSIITAIKTKISSILTAIKTTFTSIFSGIKEKVSSILTALKTWISSWGTTLKNKFKSIGKNLITGLWNGISDKVEWIKEKITGFADDVLDTIKGFFGISSPSKVFAEIGGYLAEGLGVGWDNEISDVKDAIEDDLDFGTVSIESSALGAAVNSNGTGGVSVVQNIYSQAQTAADLLREARWQQERAVLQGV